MSCARPRGCDRADGSECLVCPYAFACPQCGRPAGHPCRRPSGHDCRVHEGRVLIADKVALSEHRDQVRVEDIAAWERRCASIVVP